MIRVVIIEDEPLFIEGIKAVIRSTTMEVVGEANYGFEGLRIVQQTQPDVVLVNIGLPDTSGLEITYQIKKQTTSKVVIITSHCGEELADLALSYGADSFILKKTGIELIKQAIFSAYNNECFIDPKISKKILDNHRFRKERIIKKGKKYHEPPTFTETEILKLIASGLSNEEIAAKLFITVSTVKSHANSLLIKLNARNRTHAITRGIQLGYLNYLEMANSQIS